MKALGLILLFFFNFPTYAQWNPKSVELIHSESKKYNNFKDPATSTLWGGIRRFWGIYPLQGKTVEFETKRFKTGKLPVYLRKLDKKAPMLIFMPGIFGQHDGQVSPKLIQDMENYDAHIFVPPNFLSKNYINNSPLYGDDPSSLDIEIVLEVIDEAIKRIGQENISKVHFIGESLGTVVASGAYAEDSMRKNPILKNGTLTLLWPSVNLRNSMLSFDKRIDGSVEMHQKCYYFFQMPGLLYHFIMQETPQGMNKDFQNCMGSFLYHETFMKAANKSFEAFKEHQNKMVSVIPKNFSEFFKYYQPKFYEMLDNNDTKLNLSYWLKKGKKNNPIPIRIISSNNDFINDGIDWNKFQKGIGAEDNQIILLEWGSHCAPLALNVWKDIFQLEYQL
jgi:hypothetical protein